MRELRTRSIFDGATRKVIAIELLELHRANTGHGRQLFASLRPTAIVVCTPTQTLALDLEARPIDLDKLREDCPSLDSQIARYESGWPDSS